MTILREQVIYFLKHELTGFDLVHLKKGMPLWSLTYERVDDLTKDLNQKEKEIRTLEVTEEKKLWDEDLDELLKVNYNLRNSI